MNVEKEYLRKLIRLALAEDHAEHDVTTAALASFDRQAKADAVVKEDGVVSGTEVFTETFYAVDKKISVVILRPDASAVYKGEIIAVVSGRESSLLRAERTALNFLQHLCGIATLTRQYAEKVRPFGAILLDTRKTTPGMRLLEKKAVRDGGGSNHRLNLEEMALIKDNHIAMAGGISQAVAAVRRAFPEKIVEVEVKNLTELDEALALGVSWIMLDNFPVADLAEAVRRNQGRARLEISGNVTLDNIAVKAQIGAECISVGALTHSVRALDISLEMRRKT